LIWLVIGLSSKLTKLGSLPLFRLPKTGVGLYQTGFIFTMFPDKLFDRESTNGISRKK